MKKLTLLALACILPMNLFMVHAQTQPELTGIWKGTALLNTGGKVMIEGELYDAITRGGHIEKDEPVEVINDESNTIKVKRVES